MKRLYSTLLAFCSLLLSSQLAWAKTPPVREDVVTSPAGKALQEFRKPPREVREVQPGFLWIDAEDFADYGGWWIDTQFVAFMGSAYLIAAGVCEPVKDATTTVQVTRPGSYRLCPRPQCLRPEMARARRSPSSFMGWQGAHRFKGGPWVS